jgi:hypothetical protein
MRVFENRVLMKIFSSVVDAIRGGCHKRKMQQEEDLIREGCNKRRMQ